MLRKWSIWKSVSRSSAYSAYRPRLPTVAFVEIKTQKGSSQVTTLALHFEEENLGLCVCKQQLKRIVLLPPQPQGSLELLVSKAAF